MLRVYARGVNRRRGAELRRLQSISVSLKYREVGSWSVSGSADGLIQRAAVEGRGVIVVDEQGVPLHSPTGVLISGQVEEIGPRERGTGETAGAGRLTLSGGDDLDVVSGELAFPDPTSAVDAQTAAAYDARSGIAETVIKAYVAANVGVGRDVDRGDAGAPDAPLVTIAADLARGSTVSHQARFDPLLDVVRTLGAASTPQLAPRVQQVGDDLLFDVYSPVDRSDRVVFSDARRNLGDWTLTVSAPSVTHTVVAGAGEGSVRAFVERKDSAAAQAWRQVSRTFVDQRSTDVVSELQAAGDEALAAGRGGGQLTAAAVDTPSCRFGAHFGLGDLVAVELAPGVRYVERVTAVKITQTAKGPQPTEVTIGAADAAAPDLYRRVKELEAALSALQRRY